MLLKLTDRKGLPCIVNSSEMLCAFCEDSDPTLTRVWLPFETWLFVKESPEEILEAIQGPDLKHR